MSPTAFTTFLEALRNTSQNIGGVVKDWKRVAPELQDHYVDELTMLIARVPSAMLVARELGRRDLLEHIVSTSNEIMARAEPLKKHGLDLHEIWAHVGASPIGTDTNTCLPRP